MSDYLWDKTGEPDAEVERLEALLGGFGHTPRPLALPAQAEPFGRRRSWLFAPAGLAAAAALLLAFLAGAAVLVRSRSSAEGKSVAASGTLRPLDGALGQTARRMLEPPPPPPSDTRGGAAKDERAAPGIQRRGARDMKGVQSASLPQRRQKPAARVGTPDGGAPVFEAMSSGSAGSSGAPSLFESTRLMTKEQLVYALRLTGAKLRDVRQKTQGRDDSETTPGGRTPLK
ncbi:MAG TPA: hypothetical protein VFZ44_17595 [Pyrinomonadaceae bacterium]